MGGANMQAHLLSLNDFGMPKVYSGTSAMYTKIVYLILLEKGKFQSHPDMGVGLRSRYRFNNEENFLQTLQSDITSQISTYLPELSAIDISVNIKDHTLGIVIDTSEGAYTIAYNGSTDVVDAPATYVLEDL